MRLKSSRACLSGLLALLGLLALVGCGKKDNSLQALKVGVIPYENVTKIQDDYGAFASYLGKKCGGRAGQVFVTPEYAGVLQALKSDQIDCAYLNPLSYVLAVQEFKDTPEHLVPLAMPYFKGSLTYKGIIFVRADSGINSLQDLRGKSFAFGDRTSTSGYLYPARMFKEAGIDPDKDMKPANITGTSGVLAVLNKQVDGGASYEGAIENAFTDQTTGKVDQGKVKQFKVIATTDPIPNGMIVVRGNLDSATVEQLKKALSDINIDPEGKAALAKIPWDKVVPADDSIFDSVRKTATILGLNLQSLDSPKK